MKEKFIQFLKDNNCYDQFVYNTQHVVCGVEIKYFRVKEARAFVSKGFIWNRTIEGFEYWVTIHNKWQVHLKTML